MACKGFRTMDTRRSTPRDPDLDSTLALLREGYTFIPTRVARLGSDVFSARLLAKETLFIHGREAARLFYDESKLTRVGAIPRRVATSLFGQRGVQSLEGPEHDRRKRAFLALMSADALSALMDLMAEEWRSAVRAWERQPRVVLFDEAQRLLTRAVCRWTGVPLPPAQVAARARDLGAMVDAFGGVGPRLWRGKLARGRTERWIEQVVEDVRSGRLQPEPWQAACVMAELRDTSGQLVPAEIAAVELINVLRPTAAIAWYVAFAALALGAHPSLRPDLDHDDAYAPGGFADQVVDEIRRYYPFTPFLGAKVKTPFEWHGHRFEPGRLVVLDVYGTHHDPELWPDPERFDPGRFTGDRTQDSAFIPQGGGPELGHRCAGEWLTRAGMKLALHVLVRGVSYELPVWQDLTVNLHRMPTRPRSGVVLADVRGLPQLESAPPVSLPAHSARGVGPSVAAAE
jgi:fatty-acid peroxygenase